jgi:hypothetical protein
MLQNGHPLNAIGVGMGTLANAVALSCRHYFVFFDAAILFFPVYCLFVIRLYFGQFLRMLLSSLRICCLLASNCQERNHSVRRCSPSCSYRHLRQAFQFSVCVSCAVRVLFFVGDILI